MSSNNTEITADEAAMALIEGFNQMGRIIYNMALPTDVIFHDPATIVFWEDGTKTVVKCQPGDEYDRLTGFLLCMMKKRYGNSGDFNDILNAFDLHPAKQTCTVVMGNGCTSVIGNGNTVNSCATIPCGIGGTDE
jgi:hypothetical protein